MSFQPDHRGFQNRACPYFPCHKGVSEDEFNCLFCYCPLIWLKCPGDYTVFVDKHGQKRKDCSKCTIVHRHPKKSWKLIQRWLEKIEFWSPP